MTYVHVEVEKSLRSVVLNKGEKQGIPIFGKP